jgi:GR25 family glycosyltransferase involved in LPS biosynthesis
MSRKFTRLRHYKKRFTLKKRQKGGSCSNLFKDAYVISMDKNSERYIDIENDANNAGLVLQHWPATFLEKTEKLRYELPYKGVGRTLFCDRLNNVYNIGTVGCFLSHRELLRHIVTLNSPELGTLILEDDVKIRPDLFIKLASVERELPKDWDILFLDKGGLKKSETPISDNLVKIRKSLDGDTNWGTHCYIVKNSSIKRKILPILEHMIDGIDRQYNVHADKINQYIAYGIIPLNEIHSKKSTITEHEKSMYTGKSNKSWVLVQYDNRPIPDYYKELIEINKEYCKKYGYEHIIITEKYELPPWWIKVKICKELLESDKYSGVMWLDTDAVIYDCSKSLDIFTSDKTIDFFIAKDPPVWGAPVNAGVWIVKNTQVGKNIMRDWFNKYDKTKWIKNTTIQKSYETVDYKKWSNPLSLTWYIDARLSEYERRWAGINFEQGALYEKTMQNPMFKNHVKVLPNVVLSHWIPDKLKGTFTLQFFSSLSHITPHTNTYYIDKFINERNSC